MSRKFLFWGGIILVLAVVGASPITVQAEDDPPPTPQPVKPPWITGINPNISLSTAEQEEFTPAGIITTSQGVEVPLLAAPPDFVDLIPQASGDPTLNMDPLAVPQRYQDPADATCGAAALGMALEFLSLSGDGASPSQAALVSDLKSSGLLYETGTGVEELAFLARQYGYQGTSAFHDWTLDQLREQLSSGKPVVVSLGANGAGQPGHFVTLTGISEDGKWIIYNDPVAGKQKVTTDEFQKSWDLGGNTGLVARKEPLSAVDDPLLPWMGLFSALAALAVMSKHYPPGNEFTSTLENIRNVLSNPLRKGLGGKLIAGGSSTSPPYTAPPGYSWNKTTLPKYGWKDVTITEKVEVPNLVRTWAVVKVNRWIEKVPVYKTVKVDRGHWAYRTVTKYRTERYRTTERYKTKKYYWYLRNGRLVRGSYDVWKTRTVVKTRKVPYTERQKYWAPKIVTEKRLDYYREVEHRDPVYGWRMEKQGTRIEERTKTTRAWAPVGTETKWELEKDPTPTPPRLTPTPQNPTPTPTPYPTSTATPLYPTPGPSSSPIIEPTSTSTATPSATPDWTQLSTPETDPVLEDIFVGADALLDHYSMWPPLPGDPPPPIDPLLDFVPPGAELTPVIGPISIAIETALTLIGTTRDVLDRLLGPIVEYFQDAVPEHLDPSNPTPTPHNPTPTTTPMTPTPTLHYPTPSQTSDHQP